MLTTLKHSFKRRALDWAEEVRADALPDRLGDGAVQGIDAGVRLTLAEGRA